MPVAGVAHDTLGLYVRVGQSLKFIEGASLRLAPHGVKTPERMVTEEW